MVKKTFRSLHEIEKEYFPKTHERKYLQGLAKEGKIGMLTKYLVDNDIDMFDKELKLTRNMTPQNIGSLLAQLSIEKVRVNPSSLTI